MRNLHSWIFASLLAAAVAAAGLFAACGGAGLGIATLGISAIFAGTSPGYAVRDPRFAPASTTTSPEPDIVLSNGEAIERLLFLGGDLFRPVDVIFEAQVTGGTSAALEVSMALQRAEDLKPSLPYPVADTVNADTTPRTFTVSLHPGELPARLNPGDVVRLRFANQGPGDVKILAASAAVETRIGLVRHQRVHLADGGQGSTPFPVLRLDPAGLDPITVASNTSVTAQLLLRGTNDPGADLYSPEGADPPQSDTTAATRFTYEYDGEALFRLRVRETTPSQSGTRFDLRLESVDPAGNVTDFGTVSLSVRGDRFQTLKGRFPGAAQPARLSQPSGSDIDSALRLHIANLGPADLEFEHEPLERDRQSVLLVRGPRILVDVGSHTDLIVSQPDPDE
ncbi:MAG: hypothetical protein KatS3mg102_0018 [Planctomycetota bacterium]|nr:MAG: hypothetical protein KatS3mg102_0018 [Planctomycetota bacterium]